MSARRQFKRQPEILDAAAQVFAERGYHGASTQMIADLLGMKQASLYYYFGSKEQALYEVCRFGVEGHVEGLQAIIDEGGIGPTEKLQAGILHQLRPLRDRRNYFLVFLCDRRHLPTPERHQIGRISRRYERMWQAIIETGLADGTFRRSHDPRTATLAILGMCNSAAPWLDAGTPGVLEEAAAGFADLVLHGLRS